jgi:uncharacterized membrane protein (Fun14 family)
VGLDVVSIGSGSLLGFCSGWTNIAELFVLIINFFIFTQQRLWADGILIPHLHKALLVRRNAKTHPKSPRHLRDFITFQGYQVLSTAQILVLN